MPNQLPLIVLGMALLSLAACGSEPQVVDAPGFTIEVRFEDPPEPRYAAAFRSAARGWEKVIRGDAPGMVVRLDERQCGSQHPAIEEGVDDLLIAARLTPIDGLAGAVGAAGYCLRRTDSLGGLPIFGMMEFDTADLAQLDKLGLLESTITHEMGHVLGFGSLWKETQLLQNPSLPSDRGADTLFTGRFAVREFDEAGGDGYEFGGKVPVENERGSTGTRDGHWRESVFKEELMTGFLDASRTNPLSRITIASMQDLGYEVDYSSSETYELQALEEEYDPSFLQLGERSDSTGVALGEDILQSKKYIISETGIIESSR